jgi:predicted AlkP superfamily pyrophosphatase or phosphodiesterase
MLVVDGLGWEQLQERRHLAPTLGAMEGGPITTVAPSTTATALTSITTGLTPGEHGLIGYRIDVGGDVLNVLRWWADRQGDGRRLYEPTTMQPFVPFLGHAVPVVSKTELESSAFTVAHLRGSRPAGWRVPSSLPVVVGELLRSGERLVYAYYDGVDKVAHEYGLGEHYDAELAAADRLVADLAATLPAGAALVVTSDHGQVHVGDAIVRIREEVMDHVELLSGEGRFRWLHARPGRAAELAAVARECHAGRAWVRTREEVIADEWFGPKVSHTAAARFGDVVLAARDAVAFEDPADTGPYRLQSRHGSLTSAEMRIPLLALQA